MGPERGHLWEGPQQSVWGPGQELEVGVRGLGTSPPPVRRPPAGAGVQEGAEGCTAPVGWGSGLPVLAHQAGERDTGPKLAPRNSEVFCSPEDFGHICERGGG